MSEIICPFCGSENPIEAINCFNCKKPLYDDVDPDSSTPARDEMDWLKDFRGFVDDTAPGKTRAGELSQPVETPGSTDSDAEPEIPEWLARIRALKGEETPPPVEEESTEPEEIPAYLGNEADLPDWIKEIKQGDVPQPLEESASDIPDWLKGMAGSEELPPSEDILPDLSMISDETTELSGIQLPEIPNDLPVVELPEINVEPLPAIPGDLGDEQVDIPDDLFEVIAGQPEPAELTSPSPESLEDNLDWLEPETAEPEAAESELPEVNAEPAAETNELPGWMFEPSTGESETSAEPAELDFSTLDAGLASLGAETLPAEQPEAGLPDWLLEDAPGNFGNPPDFAAESSPNLEVGQMPGWLHAMRPLEAAAPELSTPVDENRVEPTGPLAGYQGLLPGEGVVTQYSRPPTYSSRIQVTDKQRIYATLFETLIADETRVGTPAAEKSSTLQLILRMAVGVVLVGLLLSALIFNPGLAPLPALVPPEAVVFYDTVQTLTSASTPPRVLVGLDYEPSLSGELSTIAGSVIEDWMTGNSGLAFVSLNLSGPALAQELVDTVAAKVPQFLTAERVINLGYLPGGASALAALAADPTRAAPASVDGLQAWNSLLLQGMVSVSDFDAIVLLTDNTENTRAWIEQVKPAAGDTPLLVVSSAQAAPALQPYVQSGQITGMISGFTGGAAYEQLTQASNGSIRNYWDAYQGGMLLIAAFLLLGSLVFGIINIVRRSKKA